MPVCPKIFQKIEEEGTSLNLLYEVNITLLPKSDKDTTKKVNQRPIYLIIIYVKIINKILSNQIQQHIERLITP